MDAHKRSITACLPRPKASDRGLPEIRRFGTVTRDLLELADWLQSHRVPLWRGSLRVFYWNPVRNILAGQFAFVPPTPIRQLRDLTRLRASLRQDHPAVANRVQKILEGANIKLAAVANDWLGVSGCAIHAQLLTGEEGAEKLAAIVSHDLREPLRRLKSVLV